MRSDTRNTSGITQRGFIVRPAGERLAVAMDDGDTQAADVCRQRHRQCGEACAQFREFPCCFAQPRLDGVGTFDIGVADAVRVAATAAGIVVIAGQFSFDVAAYCMVAEHGFIDGRKTGGINVEPVEVTVEHQRGRRRFGGGQFAYGAQCRLVAVKPADDIQRVGNKIRRAVQ